MTNQNNPSKNKLNRLLPLLLCSLLLSGCWDRVEVNDMAFVLGLALDKEKDGFRVSIMIPLPGNMGGTGGGGGGGGSGGDKPFAIDSEVGSIPHEAIEKLQNRLPRRLFFAHSRVLILGEAVAREGFEKFLDGVARMPENRLSTYVAVTEGKASDALQSVSRLERFSADTDRKLLQSEATIPITVKEVALAMNTLGNDAIFPYMESDKSGDEEMTSGEIRVTGFAITRYGKMVGTLKDEEALGIRWLSKKFRTYTETLETGRGHVTLKVNGNSRVKPYLQGNEIHFEIKVKALASIVEATDNRNYGKRENLHHVEELLKREIKKSIERAITALQEKKSDASAFGQYLNRSYPQKWDTEWKANWYTVFPQCKFHVSVDADIHRIGMVRENIAKRGK